MRYARAQPKLPTEYITECRSRFGSGSFLFALNKKRQKKAIRETKMKKLDKMIDILCEMHYDDA